LGPPSPSHRQMSPPAPAARSPRRGLKRSAPKQPPPPTSPGKPKPVSLLRFDCASDSRTSGRHWFARERSLNRRLQIVPGGLRPLLADRDITVVHAPVVHLAQ